MTKDHPILFSTPMVRALLDGRKTQTRRIVKFGMQPDGNTNNYPPMNACPYGKPGDLLWVRESFIPYFWNGSPAGGNAFKTEDINLTKGALKRKWKPSIHMPRLASRLTLDLTEVRVERLHACSAADALEEGAEPDRPYGTIWKAINGEASWDSNPWVWVLKFKVHQQNIDQLIRSRAA